jgi:uncharacterized protein
VRRQATHEDYTLKIVLDSSLGELIARQYGDDGIVPADIAELIAGSTWQNQSTRFRHGGVDYGPVLRQIVSSECDADRMDYLQRDSFFSGVNYGKYDADWLIDNVTPVEREGQVLLGIKSRAIYSFEDFLLSRFHMFATVYLHFTPVIFEKMLARYFDDVREFDLPADVEKYCGLDDMDLWTTLRRSKNPWARRIVERKPYVLLDERNEMHGDRGAEIPHDELMRRLDDGGIDAIATRSRSVLSKYYGHGTDARSLPMFVVDNGRAIRVGEYTPLYDRYEKPALVRRVFVDPEKRTDARAVMQALVDAPVATAPAADA